MKRILYIITTLLAFASCAEDVHLHHTSDNIPEGYTKIEFSVNIADQQGVNTRAVDPDGLAVNNMTLFCFNEYGLYISSETATLVTHTIDEGTYSAAIPNHTHIIHFLANHSEGLYDDSEFPGQTESMVIANMEGGSGMLVYWSRFKMDTSSGKTISEQLAEISYTVNGGNRKGVKLIRNQAMVTIANWETEHFVVTGFRTVNIPAFGTVAPHHPDRIFDIVADWENLDEFITLPNNQSLMSDISEINTKPEDYIFECINSGDRLVSVVIKGHAPGQTEADDKYYRIVMQGDDGNNFMIRRNHHYKINITGMLTYGQDTFEEALAAPASNNAWISIDEWVNEITDGTETLWIEKTAYVLSSDEYAGTNWTFPYRFTSTEGETDAPTVTWIENNVAYDRITNNYDPTTGEGEVTLNLYPMYEGNEQQSGTLLIKHGKLQRRMSVHVIRTQSFTPAWITSHIYGVAEENVTLVFTIPNSCPEALFPFTVLVSANHLDVRAASGQELPVYTKEQEGYFGQEWEGINYKYAYTVEGPGKHRLHMKSILKHEENDIEKVHLEANFFETITKEVAFTGYENVHKRIFVDGLHNYGTQYAEDELLYYMLLPQKKAAPLVFTIQLQERKPGTSSDSYTALNHAANPRSDQWHKNGTDEFLIYTKCLSFYDEYFKHNPGQYEEIKELAWEGEVTMFDEESWSTNGRVMAFRTYGYEEIDGYNYGLQEDGSYNIYMLTNSSYVKDVIRVSSNTSTNNHLFPYNRDSTDAEYNTKPYTGNEYRSIIFDIAHYRPYRFAAQVGIKNSNSGEYQQLVPATDQLLNNKTHQSTEESVDNLTMEYKPGQLVDIMFDITSFQGSDGRSVHPFGETFGEEFNVYIDAPMLEIDYERIPDNWLAANNNSLKQDKLRKDPNVSGRYIYTVDRSREEERNFGYTTAHNKDESTTGYDNFGRLEEFTMNQEGERKLLPFKKSEITANKDIVISSEKEKIVYWEKRYHVETELIQGTIFYEKDSVRTPIPHNDFVAFVRLRTGARIGVITITENGKFSLNLRDEYSFDWEDDPIDFYYTDTDKTVYNLNIKDNNGNKQRVDLDWLYEQTKAGEPIVLTVEEEESKS